MDIGWTSQLEESHILWRVASTGNNEECQFLSHLLAFYILPSSSPEKVQTPERLMNSPRNRPGSPADKTTQRCRFKQVLDKWLEFLHFPNMS
uniref:Uncharacterized protein n=1 Tax=Takifugu rubripes TaxID=31033 RepID=A0A674NI56_TAKRU